MFRLWIGAHGSLKDMKIWGYSVTYNLTGTCLQGQLVAKGDETVVLHRIISGTK